jgi:hypothetical protein
LLSLGTVLLFGACSTSNIAPVDRTHPASTEAPESHSRPLRPMLGGDTATQRTRELLAKRAAEQGAAESETPGDQTNIAPPTSKPSGHEHHQ